MLATILLNIEDGWFLFNLVIASPVVYGGGNGGGRAEGINRKEWRKGGYDKGSKKKGKK